MIEKTLSYVIEQTLSYVMTNIILFLQLQQTLLIDLNIIDGAVVINREFYNWHSKLY